jgi:hypothetical protein
LISVIVTADALFNESSDADDKLLLELAKNLMEKKAVPKVMDYAD